VTNPDVRARKDKAIRARRSAVAKERSVGGARERPEREVGRFGQQPLDWLLDRETLRRTLNRDG
jgi:hypothetical protein